MSRSFDLGDVLSITTGRLVSTRHMDGIYDILNYLTGDSLFTHQLPRAMDACREPLLAQHPGLAAVEVPTFGEAVHDEVLAWLTEQKRIHGGSLEVSPLAEWEHQNAIEELCDMVGSEKVYVASPDTETGQQ